jgi:hypothetical protein
MTELIAALMVAGIFATAVVGEAVIRQSYTWWRRMQVKRQTRNWHYGPGGGWRA